MTVDSSHKEELTVANWIHCWLPRTQNWMYTQVKFLPPEVKSYIVCNEITNIDEFWLPNIYCRGTASRWRHYVDAELRKFGIVPHSCFLARIAKKFRANILNSHQCYQAWKNDKTARKLELKHVVTAYGGDMDYPPASPPWIEYYRTMFEHVDLVLCEGPYIAERIVRRGCPRHKLRIHLLGIDLDKIEFKPRVWNPAKPLRVLIAARFTEKKGIPYALEALGRIQHEVPLEITIIGDASNRLEEQTEKRKILAVIKKHNLQSKIRMLGSKPYGVYLEEAYEHHVFLSPSVTASNGDTEGGMNISIVEMLASGMPVVSTKHCDIPHSVQNGVCGLLADERDVDGLVKHLRWLVDNPEKWFRMIDAGRKYVEKEFDARVQSQRLASLYHGLME
jgi:colanic acid/amylovoran biosynthesis glycosyltransferase